MIVDAIMAAVFGILNTFISLLPSAPFQSIAVALAAVSTTVAPIALALDYFFPLHELLGIVVGVYALRLAGLVIAALSWIWDKVPFLGHAAV